MDPYDSALGDYAPQAIQCVKELTLELRECRHAFNRAFNRKTDTEQENIPPTTKANVQVPTQEKEKKTQPKSEPTIAEAIELTPENRYLTLDSPLPSDAEFRAPLSNMKGMDGNIRKGTHRNKRAARKSTGSVSQSKKKIATRYDELVKMNDGTECKKPVAARALPSFSIDPVAANAPMSLALEGFSSATEVIEAAERIRRRTNPDYRSVEDAREERKTEKHTGCPSCRLHAYEASEGRSNYREIYEEIVSKCTHVPLGQNNHRQGESAQKYLDENDTDHVW